MLSGVEYLREESYSYLDMLIKRAGKAHVIGVTGPQGVGKSTLIGQVAKALSSSGRRVGVITVDPTSPFSSGSFMGNRVRMNGLDKVFIRSLATRGFAGGVGVHAALLIEAMDGLGFDEIILETVGAGQVDTDVMHMAQTVVVVLAPGVGDDVQALKSGLMEIGHIYAVNKRDLPESERLVQHVNFALSLRGGEWKPRLVLTAAQVGEGIEELLLALREHLAWLGSIGIDESLRRRRRKLLELLLIKRAVEAVEQALRISEERVEEFARGTAGLREIVSEIAREVKI
ncbi:methylmalonyl Co-A mutase-associated GTPase MeaB [Sulfodiicoccus acidiphilus]|uniref:Methylmalonyl Co-A mutase-associated GTPase MeaB n=1 Tax=Sulfodiicoccus acidiphilus TaxID=1670455 RepID=A0A348B2A4_9CREN|nr:methylmalonyl Co-A mutase-associated GTPase MeaB [Sulfodiicoccus acidiphilus]